ncbi:MAG: hypothetical protein HKL99_06190 [Burkholderiales bacterium]|nr:hypothetical protein [Burkholderiales bacterium]
MNKSMISIMIVCWKSIDNLQISSSQFEIQIPGAHQVLVTDANLGVTATANKELLLHRRASTRARPEGVARA